MRRLLPALLLLSCAGGAGSAAAPPPAKGDLPAGARLRIGSPGPPHGGLVRAACSSPAGKLLASAGHDRLVSVWDAATGKDRFRFAGHAADVTCLSFAPDGQTLLSGSSDGTARV